MDTIITDQQALDILTAMSDAVANNPELDDASPERISGFALEFVVNEVARLREDELSPVVRQQQTEIGLLKLALENKTNLLASCETSLEQANKYAAHWRANHDDLRNRLYVATHRTDVNDIDVARERLKLYDHLTARIAELEAQMRDVGTETTTVSVGELSHSVTKVIDLSEIPEGSKSEKLFDPNLFELAAIILSDCGISENNQPLYDRVLSRLINARLPITTPTEQQILTATEKAGMWPNNVRKWIPVFHRYHAELAAMSYNQVGNSAILEQAIELLKKAELEIDRHICPHDSTHRGGAIWEICDDCGAKWADDRGGKPEFKPNEVSGAIREFIKAHSNGSLNNAEPCTNSDVWNCKYCHKTNTCKAINDPRNFGGTENATIVPPTKNEPIQVTPTSKNEYGLDVSYFSDKLLSILRNIGNYKPDEMYRQLNSLVSVVAPVQPTEPEFDYTDVRLDRLSLDASKSAIEYAVTNWDLEFLHAWFHGNFDAIRKEWANVPETVFIGADPLHTKTKGETK